MPTPPRAAFVRLLSVAILFGLAGCGAEAYQSRIDVVSKPFFSYQTELEGNLGVRWRKGEVSIRLPRTFKEIPAPKKKPGTAETTGLDPRIPPGFGIDLPGLLGGFKGTMAATVAGGKTEEVPVYAYVLSNRYLLASREPGAKPQEFDGTLLNTIGAGLRKGSVPKSALKPFVPADSLAQEQKGFAPGVRLDQAVFDTTMGGVPMQYEAYVRREPPLQVAVLFVVPKEAGRDEQLAKRIDLSLLTLRIEAPGAGGAAAAPQGGSGNPGF